MKAKKTSPTTSQNLSLKSANAKVTHPSPTAGDFSTAEDAVAIRAYLNYQNHGQADGHDVADWLGAESELVAEHRTANSL